MPLPNDSDWDAQREAARILASHEELRAQRDTARAERDAVRADYERLILERERPADALATAYRDIGLLHEEQEVLAKRLVEEIGEIVKYLRRVSAENTGPRRTQWAAAASAIERGEHKR